MLVDTPNQPSKFRTKDWFEINDDTHGRYNIDNQIKLKSSMLKSSLFDYSDAYILFKWTTTVPGTETAVAPSNRDKIIFKNWALFTDCISEVNITQIDTTKDLDVVVQII